MSMRHNLADIYPIKNGETYRDYSGRAWMIIDDSWFPAVGMNGAGETRRFAFDGTCIRGVFPFRIFISIFWSRREDKLLCLDSDWNEYWAPLGGPPHL